MNVVRFPIDSSLKHACASFLNTLLLLIFDSKHFSRQQQTINSINMYYYYVSDSLIYTY